MVGTWRRPHLGKIGPWWSCFAVVCSCLACQLQCDFLGLMDRSIRVSCDFELPSHASTTCSAKKGYLEPIICMSPAVLMVAWTAHFWQVNCTGHVCPLNRSVSLFPIWNTAGSPRTPASDRREKLPGARIYIEDCFDLSTWAPWDRWKCLC